MYQPAELWYRLKFCKRTLLHQPAGLCCHDNPNYLSLRASFYTGREPLCSLGICISLGQVLKVREMNQNKNTTEKTCACVRKGDSTHQILWQAFLFVKHLLNYSLKHMVARTVETPAFCITFSRFKWIKASYYEKLRFLNGTLKLHLCFFSFVHQTSKLASF